MWAQILSGVLGTALVVVIIWMVPNGITPGTITDFLIRRCLYPFLAMFTAGIICHSIPPRTKIAAWLTKRPWTYGISTILIIELFGLYRLMTEPGTTTAMSSAILQNWLSHWWIVLLALLLGVLGAYSGSGLAQIWHKRARKST